MRMSSFGVEEQHGFPGIDERNVRWMFRTMVLKLLAMSGRGSLGWVLSLFQMLAKKLIQDIDGKREEE